MQKLKIHLQNCHGIKQLDTEFDFSIRKTHAIYAPNGIIKTSFAKTFADFSKGEESQDQIFTDRESERVIVDENDDELDKDVVFVVESNNK